MTNKLKELSAAWVTPVLGVEGKLLYFGPLLNTLSTHFSDFQVYTNEFTGDKAQARFPIITCGSFKRLYSNERKSQQQTGTYTSGFAIASPQIISRILKDKPDLLIINEFGLVSLYAFLAKLLLRKTRVVCIVETRPRMTEKPLLRVLRKLLRKTLARLANSFLTNNDEGKKYIMDMGIPESRIIARPYLVSSPGENTATSHKPRQLNDKVTFLSVGQLVKRKGIQNALRACEILAKSYPQQFLYRIVGDGPYRSELENITKTLGITEYVEFLGRKPYEELIEYYSSADAFVFPTLSDYRALSPFEALSHSLPIIASREDGGITETVEEGKNGFSFDPNSPPDIAYKMSHLLEHRGDIDRFSAHSRLLASRYTLENALDALDEAALKALE